MRKVLFILAALLPTIALADYSLGVGTYNIRYKNDGDTGVHHWDARREYVVRTIAECGFDILGLNEMNIGSMYEWLKEELPKHGFDMVLTGYRTDKDLESIQAHPIVYRSDMLEVLNKGVFYLNINTNSPGVSWDNSTHQRSTHWAKMRVKETGDIFYFFTTHLDHKGELSKNEQCRINFEKIRQIAGDYPVVISGDHNTAAGRPPFYDLFASYMLDTKTNAEVPFTDELDGTLCGWDPNTRNRTRLDYIWVRGFKVHTYEPLRETFDTPYLPSDHLALLSRVMLLSEQEGLWESYLVPGAPAGGEGTIASPFSTFAEALAGTRQGGTIRVAAGDLAAESDEAMINVDKSAVILGGYNPEFTRVVGTTNLKGDGTRRLINVTRGAFLEMSNFTLDGGYSATQGGGIYCAGPVLKLTNVAISDCHAAEGGAVYCAQQINAFNCSFTDCTATGRGGAVFADRVSTTAAYVWWRYFMSGCTFARNSAAKGSAMYVTHHARCSFNECGFFDNEATECGTVYVANTLCTSQASIANCIFARNAVNATAGESDAAKGGAAIYATMLDDSSLGIMNCTIVGNANHISGTPASDYTASTVQVVNGKVYTYSTMIGGNVTDAATPADITAAVGSGAFNCYSCTSNISYRKSITDMISTSADEAATKLCAIFDCELKEPGLVYPETVMYNDKVMSLRLAKTAYGFDDINTVPKTQFSEALSHADVDNDAEYKSTMLYDQRGNRRRTDGSSTIGAIEFQANFDAVESVKADAERFAWRQDGGDLVINAQNTVSVYDIAGRPVGRCNAGETRLSLAPGVYVLSSFEQIVKIAIR